MAELAVGTGGTYIHNTNDLQAGLKALVSPPEYLYLLEFHARDLKRDNSYHRLKVKVGPEGLHVQARRGYFEAKAPKATHSMKHRWRNATLTLVLSRQLVLSFCPADRSSQPCSRPERKYPEPEGYVNDFANVVGIDASLIV